MVQHKLAAAKDLLANKSGKVTVERFAKIVAVFGPMKEKSVANLRVDDNNNSKKSTTDDFGSNMLERVSILSFLFPSLFLSFSFNNSRHYRNSLLLICFYFVY